MKTARRIASSITAMAMLPALIYAAFCLKAAASGVGTTAVFAALIFLAAFALLAAATKLLAPWR